MKDDEDFSRCLKNSPHTGVNIDGYVVSHAIDIRGEDYKEDVWIKNTVFKDILSIENCDFKKLVFENCIFEKGLQINKNKITKEFKIVSCELEGETIFKDCNLASFQSEQTNFDTVFFCGFLHNNSIKNNDVVFVDTNCKKLSFDDLECHKNIQLKSLNTEELTIYRSVFLSAISFGDFDGPHKFYAKNVYYESSKFLQRIDFNQGEVKEILYFHKIEFEEQVVLRREMNFKGIDFVEIRAKYTVGIDFHDNLERIHFCNCRFETSFSLNSFKREDVYKKRISLNFTGVIYGNYFIEQVPTLSIDLSCINFGNLIFNNINTKFIIITDFFNYNKLFFNSIKYDLKFNALIIYDSSIGNTEFENIDFRKYDEVVVAKSDVSSMLLTNSLFPKDIQIKSKEPWLGFEIPENISINKNMYFRDSYRQLKIAMEKMGNRYYALIYKSKEMYYHRRELSWGWDKLLLYINYLSNKNGISWARGIFFTLSCALIAFILLNNQLEKPLFWVDTEASLDETICTLKYAGKNYITYLSSYPILKIYGLKENWIVNFIVLLSRIFVSVGIYQTITAFRKYAK